VIERLIRESKTWALVDGLAIDVVGTLLLRDPTVVATLDRWAETRTSGCGARLSSRGCAPCDTASHSTPSGRYADRMLNEREFFIGKAIGWVLQDTSKTRPDEVYAWLVPRAHRASGVTMRGAVKYLPATRADELTQAYRRRSADTIQP